MKRNQLPEPLKNLDCFNRLTDSQVSDFCTRLDYIQEIVENIELWIRGKSDWRALRLFLDDLELDVSENAVLSSEGKKDNEIVSSWVIHSTWCDDIEPNQLKKSLDPEVASFMNSQNPTWFFNEKQINEWLDLLSRSLRLMLANFYNSKHLETTLAYYLAIDVTVAKMLAGLYLLRFATLK